MAALRFTVDAVPVPCARPRVVNGHAFVPTRTRDFERVVRDTAKVAVMAQRWTPAEDSAFSVTLHVYRAAKRGDWDNFAKGVCDGLNGAAWRDDRAVVEAHVFLHVDRIHPRVEIEVAELGRAA
jgi:Holliday junction resolvase RusA-like endonuclease